jgi:signal transduction histidine kinase
LVREAANRARYPMLRRSRAFLARQSSDGRYWYFLALQRQNWLNWIIQPRNYLIIFGTLLLLCYGFARHLTDPVRQLQKAVECFGRGELGTRVNSKRKDELGQLARTFDQMAGRLQTLLEAERRLLLDISHELRSPLARLSVAVELARSSSDAETHLNRIQKEADRLNALVGELLQVTRAEGDPAHRRIEPFDLRELVMEVVDDCRVEAEARGCGIEFVSTDIVNDAATPRGDEELVRRAIENVLRNAIRYEPPGSAVQVSLANEQGQWKIRVRDHGPGIPEGAEARIFDAFYRVEADRDRSSGGVGLGLSIARRAVELHEGRISALNRNPGLEVEIALPA